MRGRETELFLPIKNYLLQKGYDVYAEVKNCDIAAVKDDNLVIIETKNSLSLKLILQGIERQTAGFPVYLAVGIRNRQTIKDKKSVLKLLRRLGLGLIIVSFLSDSTELEILLNPGDGKAKPGVNRRKRKAILEEIGGRYRDFNTGGSVASIETMTAYRLNAIRIAVILEKYGPSSPSEIRKHNAAGNVQSILYKNYYGWFERNGKGVYSLSEKGKHIPEEYPRQSEFFRNNLK